MLDGVRIARVELSGRHGRTREMVIEVQDWETIANLREWWTVCTNGGSRRYVVSGSSKLGPLTGQSRASHPRTTLARLLTGVRTRAEAVWNVSGDFLDLRRANLEVIPRTELHARLRQINRLAA